MPERVIEKIKKSILPQWKACFIWALVVGAVAHIYKITNWLPNWDSLVYRHDSQNMISMGRWFLSVVSAPSSFYDLPFITGLMASIFHALGAVCICRMFDVRKNITAALIGAVVVTFPTVTSVMMYNYVADGYALAFLFSCMAAMLMVKEKPCYTGSAILIALSAGIYQAYITVTIMLLLLSLILELIYKKLEIRKFLLKCIKFFLTGALGMALYYAVMIVLLKITGTALLEYQGFDKVASLEGIQAEGAFYKIKETLVCFFFDFSLGLNAHIIINLIVFVLTAFLYVTEVIKNRLGISRILMLGVCVCLLPIGACALCLVNSSIDYHNLMNMGFVVFYLFFILQYESAETENAKFNAVKSWAILSAAVLLVFNQVIIANVSYHKLNMAYEKSYGTLIRIADRIEQTDGAKECDSILVLGQLPESEAYSAKLPPDMTGTTDGYLLRADDETVGQSVLCSALNDYCGKNYRFVSGKEKIALLERVDMGRLNCWPQKDCISVIDNVIVIKLGN